MNVAPQRGGVGWPRPGLLATLRPLVVRTTDGFDPSTVDPSTVEFASAPPVRWAMEDLDGDGDTDLLLHFKMQELSLTEDSTEAFLNGMTHDRLPIWGKDTVNIVL